MPDVVTIGETMVAMLPSKYGALRYVTDFHMTAAGAESNLAIGLSKLGHDVGWVSRLGKDEMGLYILCARAKSSGDLIKEHLFRFADRYALLFRSLCNLLSYRQHPLFVGSSLF